MIEPHEIKEKAENRKKANKKLFRKLKKQRPGELDSVMAELHYAAFEKINCLDCANCCKSISPLLIDKDIQRIAKFLKIKPSELVEKYLKNDEEGDYVFQKTPCPFLQEDNYCRIYDVRPRACREYPHTDRKRFISILDLTFKNLSVCPAVYDIVEELHLKY
jgi:hypothetical protein